MVLLSFLGLADFQIMKVVFVATLLVVGSLTGVNLYDQYAIGDSFEPLVGSAYESPQLVDREWYRPGETVYASGKKCNTLGGDVLVTGRSSWRRIDNGGTLISETLRGSIVISPGVGDDCPIRNWENKIPADLEPGVWVYMGVDEAYMDGKIQRVPWTTEDFMIIGQDQPDP
jgi:hypothetical protein